MKQKLQIFGEIGIERVELRTWLDFVDKIANYLHLFPYSMFVVKFPSSLQQKTEEGKNRADTVVNGVPIF